MIEKRLAEPLFGLTPAEVDAGQGSLLDGQELL